MPVHFSESHQTSFFRSLQGRPSGRGTGAVIDDAAIAGPREAPAMTKVIFDLRELALFTPSRPRTPE